MVWHLHSSLRGCLGECFGFGVYQSPDSLISLVVACILLEECSSQSCSCCFWLDLNIPTHSDQRRVLRASGFSSDIYLWFDTQHLMIELRAEKSQHIRRRNNDLCEHVVLCQGLWSFCFWLALQSLNCSVQLDHAGRPGYPWCTANIQQM